MSGPANGWPRRRRVPGGQLARLLVRGGYRGKPCPCASRCPRGWRGTLFPWPRGPCPGPRQRRLARCRHSLWRCQPMAFALPRSSRLATVSATLPCALCSQSSARPITWPSPCRTADMRAAHVDPWPVSPSAIRLCKTGAAKGAGRRGCRTYPTPGRRAAAVQSPQRQSDVEHPKAPQVRCPPDPAALCATRPDPAAA